MSQNNKLISTSDYKRRKKYNIDSNKDIKIKKVDGIYIDNFRKFSNQQLDLGNNLTVIFGRNGTLKTSVMGLVTHPFNTNSTDIFSKTMKTNIRKVFNISPEKDKEKYKYNLLMTSVDNEKILEPVNIYLQKVDSRLRLVPSGNEKGDGFFLLPTVYTKLDRVYPLVDSKITSNSTSANYTELELKKVSEFYKRILIEDSFSTVEEFSALPANSKVYIQHAFGPKNALYDKDTISSGEYNLGSFINTMLSFERLYNKNSSSLTGIWSIDEVETSLHPNAQINLIQYLLNWSKNYNVQVILNTHSLSILRFIYNHLRTDIDKGDISLNNISTLFSDDLIIQKNPPYSIAYKELTLEEEFKPLSNTNIKQNVSVTIFCEDDMAKRFISEILKSTKLKKCLQWETEVTPNKNGTSFVLLEKLSLNYHRILDEVNAIIISDADAETNIKSKNKLYKRHLFIPSLMQFPIEKELVWWIITLKKDDSFFKKKNKAKDMFRNEFNKFNLPISENIKEFKNTKTTCFKNWFNSYSKKEQTSLIRAYRDANEKELFAPFREKVKKHVTEIYKDNGINLLL
ncbi:AAA family ATPase [Ligilactobacillus agilis]|uniref:AAA family ATPase n=1 Tax=Ligilactobacillus agilis TaxID=1601 RepID=UPI003D801425